MKHKLKKIDIFNLLNFLDSGIVDVMIKDYLIENPNDTDGAYDYILNHLVNQEGLGILLNTTDKYIDLIDMVENRVDFIVQRVSQEHCY